MNRSIFWKLLRLGILILVLAFVGVGVIAWWAADHLASPERRSVQSLANPYFTGERPTGFQVERFTSGDGMPCLVCIPVPNSELSERAVVIRKQLSERGQLLPEPGVAIGNLLILHGRGGNKEDYLPVAERFCAAGFRCFIPDLPGHGEHPRNFTTYGVLEAKEVLRCFAAACIEYESEEQPNFIFGQSMGGSVAMHVMAEENSEFSAAVVLSSFDRLDSVVSGQAEGLVGGAGARLLLPIISRIYAVRTGVSLSEIRPVDLAEKNAVPTLVLHGAGDRFVETAGGRRLFDAMPEGLEKRWIEVPDANHNNVLITDFPVYATMAEWFLKHAGG